MPRFLSGAVNLFDNLNIHVFKPSSRHPASPFMSEKTPRVEEEELDGYISSASSSSSYEYSEPRSPRLGTSKQRASKSILIVIVSTLSFLALLIFSARHGYLIQQPTQSVSWVNPTILLNPHHDGAKYAYAVLLSQDGFGESNDQQDPHYFTGTRMLIHELLHDPYTRGNRTDIDFLVLVTKNVSKKRRARLEAEGAIVLDAPHLEIDWLKPGGFGRWTSVMDKLEVFRLLQYEKVLLLDTDVVVLHPIDDVFVSPEAEWQYNRNDSAHVLADEGTQPTRYLMSANSDPGKSHRDHKYPPPKNQDLNAGFVLLGPSLEAYGFYMSVAQIPDRFNSFFPEQDLWNYTHRRDGNMPWTQLDVSYNVMEGNRDDMWHGMKSFHEKYWAEGDDTLRAVLNQAKGRMEGFWEGVGMPWPRT